MKNIKPAGATPGSFGSFKQDLLAAVGREADTHLLMEGWVRCS
jgi:hypothetical protein